MIRTPSHLLCSFCSFFSTLALCVCFSLSTQLFTCLHGHCTLHTLLLRSNRISCEGGQALGALLRANRALEHVDLRLNFIADAGGEAVARALAFAPSLTHLNLQSRSTHHITARPVLARALFPASAVRMSSGVLSQCMRAMVMRSFLMLGSFCFSFLRAACDVLSFRPDNNFSNITAESFLHSLPHSRVAVLLLDGNRIDFPHFHALSAATARSKRRHDRSALAWQHALVADLLKEKAKFASVLSFLSLAPALAFAHSLCVMVLKPCRGVDGDADTHSPHPFSCFVFLCCCCFGFVFFSSLFFPFFSSACDSATSCSSATKRRCKIVAAASN